MPEIQRLSQLVRRGSHGPWQQKQQIVGDGLIDLAVQRSRAPSPRSATSTADGVGGGSESGPSALPQSYVGDPEPPRRSRIEVLARAREATAEEAGGGLFVLRQELQSAAQSNRTAAILPYSSRGAQAAILRKRRKTRRFSGSAVPLCKQEVTGSIAVASIPKQPTSAAVSSLSLHFSRSADSLGGVPLPAVVRLLRSVPSAESWP